MSMISYPERCQFLNPANGQVHTWICTRPATWGGQWSWGCYVCNSAGKDTAFGRVEVESSKMLQLSSFQARQPNIFFCFFPKTWLQCEFITWPFALPPAVQVWAGSGSHVSAHEICTIDCSPVASNNSHFSRASVRQSDDCFVEWRMPISISWLTKCAFTVVLCGDAANVENMKMTTHLGDIHVSGSLLPNVFALSSNPR